MTSASWKKNIKDTYGVAYVGIGLINKKEYIKREITTQLKKLAEDYPEENISTVVTDDDINIPATHDGKMFNHAYVYFSNWRVFNAFIGLNFDGTPRKKYNLGGQIKLDKLDERVFELTPGENYDDLLKVISSNLNKITESSFDRLADEIAHKCIKHPVCLKFLAERVIHEIESTKPQYDLYLFKARILEFVLMKLKDNGEHEKLMKILYFVLSKKTIEYNLFAFSCILLQKGVLGSENFKEILESLDPNTAVDYFTKAARFTEGDFWVKCGRKLHEEFIKFSKVNDSLEPRVKFNVEHLRNEIMKKKLDTVDEEDWCTEVKVEDLEPLVKFNNFILPQEYETMMRENYISFMKTHPNLPKFPPNTRFLAGIAFCASFLRPVPGIVCHNVLISQGFPGWITQAQVMAKFKRFSTHESYPKITIDKNKMSCRVEFSPDQAHFEDAGFAQQMLLFTNFTDGNGRIATAKFDFIKEYNAHHNQQPRRR